ncbi:hypothetical protein MKX03_031421 [Papaver bracteatum]|nr:hypothetical protein MKX03_031421 [Papaver bracteatum]
MCFHEFPRDGVCATACGHLFCKLCWTQYVSKHISDGPGCLKMQCPGPSCAAAVGQDMINELVCDEDKEKYARHLLRSYVDDQRNIKWCPGPGCEYAVGFIGDNLGYYLIGDSSVYDVVCNNGHSFCWNCLDDAHSPVDCDTAGKWAMQNSNEPENLTWILANSKPCPQCKRPIEKNQGGMHMTCCCGFEFCWLCLSDWLTHWESTGDYHSCNVYEKARAEGVYDEEEKSKKEAKDYLDKYAFYYERFAENQKSRLKAAASFQKFKAQGLAKLSYIYYMPVTDFEFITYAWQQIMECRRVLQWIYVYAYYLPTSEHVKKPLLDYHQSQAESALERLHECAEQEIQKFKLYPQEDDAARDFINFRRKLRDLTSITRTYFQNLVRSLENGLSDLGSR